MEKLSEFLQKKKLDDVLLLQKILELKIPYNSAIYIYSSEFENLGNQASDIDVYVVYEGNFDIKEGLVRNIKVNNITLDVEFWSIELLNKMKLQLSLEKDNLDSGQLKLLSKLYNSAIIYNKTKTTLVIEKEILVEAIINHFTKLARSHYDDGISMFKSQQNILAIEEFRRALTPAEIALNAANGYLNIKEKWSSKIFLDSNVSDELKQDYLSINVYSDISNDNIGILSRKYADLVSNILSETMIRQLMVP